MISYFVLRSFFFIYKIKHINISFFSKKKKKKKKKKDFFIFFYIFFFFL